MMHYRRFGRTELKMPVLSCGGMRYQQSWEDIEEVTPESQANVESCIRRSLEIGVNHIETARGYGSSEFQLGKILPTLPREELIVQTKVSPNEKFAENFDRSMSRLRLDHVDLLGIHGINNRALLDATLAKGGALEQARRFQKEGRVRHLGFSTHAPLDVIVAAIETGEFDYVNLHWYWINQTNWPAIEAATRHDVGVFIISPNDKGGRLWDPSEKLKALCAPYSPMVFNDLFCLLRPEVHTLSQGVAKADEFDEHLRSMELLAQAAEIVPPIVERLEDAMAESVGADWLERWAEGIPPWEEVPGDINLRETLRMWTLTKSLDLVAFAKMRYNLLGQADHWFPGKPFSKEALPSLSGILNQSPFAARLPEILVEADTLLREVPVERLSKE